MSSSRRRYSRECKLEVVRRVDETGRGLSSGTYLLKLEAGGYAEMKRMTLIR